MTRLNDLLNSLTALIIRYHDAQVPGPERLIKEVHPDRSLIKSKELSASILENKDYQTTLKTYITKCTAAYSERVHLLHFILSKIVLLNLKKAVALKFKGNFDFFIAHKQQKTRSH
jgi:hypothetical protein